VTIHIDRYQVHGRVWVDMEAEYWLIDCGKFALALDDVLELQLGVEAKTPVEAALLEAPGDTQIRPLKGS
jgi:hypothetical protein